MVSMAAGTITFTGKVIDQTCKVDVGGGKKDLTVELPDVSKSQLATKGDTAGMTPFKLFVSECRASNADIAVNTVFSGAALTDNQNLKNLGDAVNVEIQLLKGVGTRNQAIALTPVTKVDGLKVPAGQQTVEYDFAAQYYAAGAVEPGSVKAIINYDITYN